MPFGFFSKKPQAAANSGTHLIIQQLEEIIIRLQTSINSLKIGFIIVDTNSELVNINESAKFLLCMQIHRNPSNMARHICTVAELGEKIKLVVDLQKQINECLQRRTAVILKDVPLQDQYLYFRLYPILLGGSKTVSKNILTGVSIIIEDVTQQKIALRSRDEFLSIASHELRTPLTAIRGNASLIKEYYTDLLKEHDNLREMIDDIEGSGVHLIKIVNDFLSVSRLEQGKLTFNRELFNLLDCINEVFAELKFTAQEKKLTLTIQNTLTPVDKLYVIADEVRTREVIYNLVGNAIKYTEKGAIKILISVAAEKVEIKVEDTGRGIPIQNQALLFKKFQQAGKSIYTRDSSSGTGLGLYISRLLAERMGGTLYLERSDENVGSVFVFTLPTANKLEIKMLHPNNDTDRQGKMVNSGV